MTQAAGPREHRVDQAARDALPRRARCHGEVVQVQRVWRAGSVKSPPSGVTLPSRDGYANRYAQMPSASRATSTVSGLARRRARTTSAASRMACG